MKKSKRKYRRFLKYIILFVIIFGLLLTFSNLKKLKHHLFELDFVFFSAAVTCSLIIYGLEGIFLFTTLKLLKEKLPILLALKYSLIINAVGYLISFGGITPFATQIHVLDYQNISIQKATTSRVVQVLFFNAFFNILLIFGLISILLNNRNSDDNLTVVIITTSFFLIIIIGFYLAIFWTSFRKAALKLFFTILNGIIKLFSNKYKLSLKWALYLLNEFNNGFRSTLKNPLYLITFFIITIIDWSFWLLVMYFSFLTVHYPVKIGTLIIGFSIGQIVSVFSMVPGGVGTMEGAMALIYKILGIPLSTTLVAVLIYRISFYIIPYFLSLPFYLNLKYKIEDDS